MASSGKPIDRRSFLKLSAATTGIAIGGCSRAGGFAEPAPGTEMLYRPLGDTGLKVSEISFGSYGFDNPALLLAALDVGINTICTSATYQDHRAEEKIGEAIASIGGRRDELVLFTATDVKPGATKEKFLDAIDGSLRRLQTDHIEIYRVTGVGSPDALRVEAFHEAVAEAQEAGKIGHVGMSGHHGGMEECLEAAIDDGRFNVLLTKYDFASYPRQDEILGRASKKGVGTIVFKTNAGNRKKEIKDLEKNGLSFTQATVKWALANPDVASVCVGITNFDQIREYAGVAGTRLTEAETAMLYRYADEMYDKYCRFCGECEAVCPQGVAVADVNRFAMYFKYYGREKDSMQLYDSLPAGCSATACESCSAPCERRCPFGRAVQAELVDAHRLLSFPKA